MSPFFLPQDIRVARYQLVLWVSSFCNNLYLTHLKMASWQKRHAGVSKIPVEDHDLINKSTTMLLVEQPWLKPSLLNILKQACCAGCRRRPFLMQHHQQAKSTPSVKWQYLLNHWSNFDAFLDLESSWSLWHCLIYNWKSYLYPFGLVSAIKL